MAATTATLNSIPADRSRADHPDRSAAMKFTYATGDTPLDGYAIKRGIGIGGFGEVYFATSAAGKEVALKRIQRNLEVELRGVAHCLNLKHPNLISLYDVRFDEHEQAWVVMEYVSGPSLRDALDAAPQGLPDAEVRRWFGGLAAGVAHLHDSGIVHRDLKPGNIFSDRGLVKIGDYGLSKFISASRRGGQTESIGTFHYMAPEVGRGEYGKEIDVYAVGVILYEMVTGRLPFDGESSHEIVMKHLTADPDLTDIPAPYADVIGRALQKAPAKRPPSLHAMLAPLGMSLDEHGLVRSTASEAARRPAPSGSAGQVEPLEAELASEPERAAPRSVAAASVAPAAVAAPAAADTADDSGEPLARAVRRSYRDLRGWWTDLALTPGVRLILLALAAFVVLLNTNWLVPLLSLVAIVYVPYYVVRQLVLHAAVQPPVTCGAAVAPRRMPMRPAQWRQLMRGRLAEKPPSRRAAELTGSWTAATIGVVVAGAFAALLGLRNTVPTAMAVAPYAWSASIALVGAFLILGLGKLWEARDGEGLVRRTVLLGVGGAIGALAFALAGYLMIPVDARLGHDSLARKILGPASPAIYSDAGRPMLEAFMAHFALLMAGLRWWKPADPLRRTRLSLWRIGVTVVAAWAVNVLLPIPQPWGMLAAGGMALAIQLAAPWENPRGRLYERTV